MARYGSLFVSISVAGSACLWLATAAAVAQPKIDVAPAPPMAAPAVPLRPPMATAPTPPAAAPKPAPGKTDEPAPTIIPSAPVDPDLVRLHLMDGSIISGKLTIKELPVETQFGKLTIPVTSLKSFTPGLGSHPELAKDLSQYIKDLGSEEFSKRELAQRALLRQGTRIKPELEKYSNDPDTERRTRVKAILHELDDQSTADEDEAPPAEAAPLIHRDTIETTEFTLVGVIVPKEFQVTSPYGALTVKLSDVRRVQRDVGRVEEIRKTLTVDGTNIIQFGAKSAAIRLDQGDRVTVTAEGTLRLPPWGNQAQSTPEGAPNFGWYIANSIPTGALMAQVGSGEPFKIGAKHTFTADKAGALSFAIAMVPDYAGNQFPGKYTLKIRVEKK